MKRIIALLLVAILAFSLAACSMGKNDKETGTNNTATNANNNANSQNGTGNNNNANGNNNSNNNFNRKKITIFVILNVEHFHTRITSAGFFVCAA